MLVLGIMLISSREGVTRSCDFESPQLQNQEDTNRGQGDKALLGHPSRMPSLDLLHILSTKFGHHLS